MKITIDIDEKEIVAGIIQSVMDLDKSAMKHLLRTVVKELALSINKQTAKVIAEKYVEIESEINYQAGIEK